MQNMSRVSVLKAASLFHGRISEEARPVRGGTTKLLPAEVSSAGVEGNGEYFNF